MISGEVLKYRNGIRIGKRYEITTTRSNQFSSENAPDSVAELSSEVGRDQSSRLSAWVEWEVRDQVKLTLSVNTGRESSTNISVHEAAGGLLYQDARDYDAVPAVSIGLRFNR